MNLADLKKSGIYTGPPVKREIEWEKDGETLKFDVYVRRLSYQTALTDIRSTTGNGDPAAARIAHCICDEHGKPVFSVSDITGINDDGTPIMEGDVERGALDSDLTLALLTVIGEVNGLGKQRLKNLSQKKKSGTS